MHDNRALAETPSATDNLLDRWLRARRELIATYCLTSKNVTTTTSGNQLRRRLGRFLDKLVDYVSEGHFEVYGALLNASDNESSSTSDVLRTIYPEIARSTELALAFDDHCANHELDDIDDLLGMLSDLGEVMEARFASEDRLISAVKTTEPLAA